MDNLAIVPQEGVGVGFDGIGSFSPRGTACRTGGEVSIAELHDALMIALSDRSLASVRQLQDAALAQGHMRVLYEAAASYNTTSGTGPATLAFETLQILCYKNKAALEQLLELGLVALLEKVLLDPDASRQVQVSALHFLSTVCAFSMAFHAPVLASHIPNILVDICRSEFHDDENDDNDEPPVDDDGSGSDTSLRSHLLVHSMSSMVAATTGVSRLSCAVATLRNLCHAESSHAHLVAIGVADIMCHLMHLATSATHGAADAPWRPVEPIPVASSVVLSVADRFDSPGRSKGSAAAAGGGGGGDKAGGNAGSNGAAARASDSGTHAGAGAGAGASVPAARVGGSCTNLALLAHSLSRASSMDSLISQQVSTTVDEQFTCQRINAAMALAILVGHDEENPLLACDAELVHIMLDVLEHACRRELRYVWKLCQAFANLAVTDANKHLIISQNGISVMGQCLLMPHSHMAAVARFSVMCLWHLAFLDEGRAQLKARPDIIEAVRELALSSTDTATKDVAKGCLLALGVPYEIKALHRSIHGAPLRLSSATAGEEDDWLGKEEPTPPAPPPHEGHLMLSYEWGSQQRALLLKTSLTARGYKVWMDVEKMSGSTLESMALAVENADAVLVCYSRKYKESQACRTEAEYAFSMKKRIIPILMEAGYRATGWLGALLGCSLYFDCSDRSSIPLKILLLERELGNTGRAAPPPKRRPPLPLCASQSTSRIDRLPYRSHHQFHPHHQHSLQQQLLQQQRATSTESAPGPPSAALDSSSSNGLQILHGGGAHAHAGLHGSLSAQQLKLRSAESVGLDAALELLPPVSSGGAGGDWHSGHSGGGAAGGASTAGGTTPRLGSASGEAGGSFRWQGQADGGEEHHTRGGSPTRSRGSRGVSVSVSRMGSVERGGGGGLEFLRRWVDTDATEALQGQESRQQQQGQQGQQGQVGEQQHQGWQGEPLLQLGRQGSSAGGGGVNDGMPAAGHYMDSPFEAPLAQRAEGGSSGGGWAAAEEAGRADAGPTLLDGGPPADVEPEPSLLVPYYGSAAPGPEGDAGGGYMLDGAEYHPHAMELVPPAAAEAYTASLLSHRMAPVERWTVEQVSDWLCSAAMLPDLAPVLAAARIDGRGLCGLMRLSRSAEGVRACLKEDVGVAMVGQLLAFIEELHKLFV